MLSNNKPFSAIEKKELKDTDITFTQLNKKYNLAKQRANTRGVKILPIYTFYREYLSQLKSLSKKLNTTPSQLMPLVDVHSEDGTYLNFRLMLRNEHKLLHSEQYQQRAKTILEKGFMTCRHCGEEKPLVDFVKSISTYTGRVTTCKKCDLAMRKANKNLGVA
ncbi:hypothetical protein MNB_SV-3-914 [hydrothermal vent metagenome]|uniref:Uncharacterized protein n=1 Tax=hydrothermal vent metagenome TaxID=652676 RepID=A0A1W1BES8_9ZZZZ